MSQKLEHLRIAYIGIHQNDTAEIIGCSETVTTINFHSQLATVSKNKSVGLGISFNQIDNSVLLFDKKFSIKRQVQGLRPSLVKAEF